jgi:hypothetical protein
LVWGDQVPRTLFKEGIDGFDVAQAQAEAALVEPRQAERIVT